MIEKRKRVFCSAVFYEIDYNEDTRFGVSKKEKRGRLLSQNSRSLAGTKHEQSGNYWGGSQQIWRQIRR